MSKRGFTLIEVAMSLTLIGVLAAATASWTTSTLRLERERSAHADAQHQIEILDRAIRLDLIQLDTSTTDRTPRVSVTDGTLRIRTRDRGRCVAQYRFDENGSIRRAADGQDVHSSGLTLHNFRSCAFSIHREPDSPTARLSVVLQTQHGKQALAYTIPAGWTE